MTTTETKLCYRHFDGYSLTPRLGGFEIGIPEQAIHEYPLCGSADSWAEEWVDRVDFSHITDEVLADALSAYTDWDVSDRRTNMMRAIWIAAGDFQDGYDLEIYNPEHHK